MDGKYNCQVSRENIIVLRAKVFNINERGLKGIDLSEGEGYYMSNGKVIDIRWRKAAEGAPFEYKTEDGQTLAMMPGASYVCIVPKDANVSIS